MRTVNPGVFGVLCLLSATAVAWMPRAAGADPVVAGSSAAEKTEQRVVIQVSDDNPKTWNQALNVVRNLEDGYGKDHVEIELVAFGNGIGMLTMESEVGNRVADAVAAGTAVYACENTMRARKLSKDAMLASVRFVPAGVVEIVTKQSQGWAVIRP